MEMILEGLFAKGPEPGFCCIGITDHCFFKCKMCDKWKTDISVKPESRPPAVKEWKHFIYQLSRMVKHRLKGHSPGSFEINFAGGESLTHPHTLELVRYASDLGFRTVIPSNGYLIDKRMAEKLNKAGLSALNLSLDSLDPAIHDKFRGFPGAYKGVMRAIEAMRPYRFPEIGIITIIHDKTYKGTVDLVKWVESHDKLNWVLCMAIMQPNNTIFESGWYSRQDFSELWPKDKAAVIDTVGNLIRIKKEEEERHRKGHAAAVKLVNTMPQLSAFRNYFSDPESFVKNERSCNLDNAIQVSAVGEIYMCYHYDQIGSVHKGDFPKAWKARTASHIRKKIKSCRTNCHELINCYFEDEYPFDAL
ncbi:MAG: radical SAM protein [Nanoarchaeota archaeon]|nr:radical SAM protein [Nanoarchaeota archaeon]